MPFTKENVGRVDVALTYVQIIDGVEKESKCVYACRRRKNQEVKQSERDNALQPAQLQQPEINPSVETLASVLIEEPQGFDDFPKDGRPLSERVIEYFNGTETEVFAIHATNEYRRLTWPVEFFRTV